MGCHDQALALSVLSTCLVTASCWPAIDVNRLGELVDHLLLGEQTDGDAGGTGDNGDGDPVAAEHTAAAAADPPATSSGSPVHADARSKGSSGSGSRKTGSRSGGASGNPDVDEYATDKDPARRDPPDAALWNRVLDAMQLTPTQLEALAEVRCELCSSTRIPCGHL